MKRLLITGFDPFGGESVNPSWEAVSNSAGAFVCNDVLYTLLHHYAGTSVRVGFVHVPRVPEQGEPSLPLEKTVEALVAAIEIL